MSLLYRNDIVMNLISVENLTLNYGSNTVLRDVDFKIDLGEIITIVGPNGSGKTSLLKAIIGAIQPAKGFVKLKPGLKIGYVPQRLNFESTLPITVERFLRLIGKIDRASCILALETAGVPELLKSQMSELSGGQFQRVLLARSLLGNPEILILDEFTSALDHEVEKDILNTLEKLKKKLTIILSTHKSNILYFCDKLYHIQNGKLKLKKRSNDQKNIQ